MAEFSFDSGSCGVDLVGALKSNGAKIDVWTLDLGLDGGSSNDELLAVLGFAFECGVDQNTTISHAAVEHIWKSRRASSANAP